MTTAADILIRARQQRAELWLKENGNTGYRDCPPYLVEQIRRYKPEIVRMLRQYQPRRHGGEFSTFSANKEFRCRYHSGHAENIQPP